MRLHHTGFLQLSTQVQVPDVGDAARGEEAVLRSVEQLQQASQPLYNNLFLPFSNQPNGDTPAPSSHGTPGTITLPT